MRAFCLFLLLAYASVMSVGVGNGRICTEASGAQSIEFGFQSCCSNEDEGKSQPLPIGPNACEHCIDIPLPTFHPPHKAPDTKFAVIGDYAPTFAPLITMLVASGDAAISSPYTLEAAYPPQHPATLISTIVLRC